MRSATGGSFPAFTRAASCGASPKALGNFEASVTTSGPSNFPMSLLPLCASAPAATTPLKAATTRTTASRVWGGLFRIVRHRVVIDASPLVVQTLYRRPGADYRDNPTESLPFHGRSVAEE